MSTRDNSQNALTYDESYAQYSEHPGTIAAREWSNFELIWHDIYWGNCKMLDAICENHKTDSDSIVNIMSAKRDGRDDRFGIIATVLYNFVSASSTLTDHARRLTNHQTDKKLIQEYKQRVKVLDGIGYIHVVKNLRNYFVHYDVPPFQIQVDIDVINGNEELNYNLVISDQLLAWDGWSSTARTYLESLGKKIIVQDLVNAHREDIDTLYDWLGKEYHAVHSSAISEANRLAAEHNRRMREHLFKE